jgi:hypothetical protein
MAKKCMTLRSIDVLKPIASSIAQVKKRPNIIKEPQIKFCNH